MAEIKGSGDKAYISLTVSNEFILKYNLEGFKGYYEYNPWLADLNLPGTVTVVFRPIFLLGSANKEFLLEYLDYFMEFLEENSLSEYADELLFFCILYLVTRISKQSSVRKDRYLNERAKLLLMLLKVPLPEITIDDFKEALTDYAYMEGETQEDIDYQDFQSSKHVAAMLHLITGKDDSYFLTDNYSLDKNKIDKHTEKLLIEKLNEEYNVAIRTPNKVLLISRNVQINFSEIKVRKSKGGISSFDQEQNKGLVKTIGQALVEEQQQYNTAFYQELIKVDIGQPVDFDELGKLVGLYKSETHHVFILKTMYDRIQSFLSTQKLLESPHSDNTKRNRDKFLYKYFIACGIPLNGGLADSAYNVERIKNALKSYTDHERHLYANKAFQNTFKNLKKTSK